MSYLVFESKDSAIAKHYEVNFGDQFTREMREVQTANQQAEMLRRWNETMIREANRQEHYDYTEVNGVREVIYVDGIPKLLIPEVRIVP